MIDGRLTHIKSERLYNREIYNIFCYYGYTWQKKSYENIIKYIDLAKYKIQNENLENVHYLGDFIYVTGILERNSRKFEQNEKTMVIQWETFQTEFDT